MNRPAFTITDLLLGAITAVLIVALFNGWGT